MPPVKFTIDPDVFQKEKQLTTRTQKDYTSKLNMLAKSGWTDRASLKKEWKAVLTFIKEKIPDDDEKARQQKRYILYAIFWSMDSKYIAKSNPYYTYLKKIPPLVNVTTKEDWIPLKEYREKVKKESENIPESKENAVEHYGST
jgi:hypothetical protein